MGEVIRLRPSAAEHTRHSTSTLLVPATDTQGHAEKVGTRIPPNMHRAVQTLVQSPDNPWETSQDFIRWAIWQGLQQAGASVNGLDNTLGQVKAMVRIMAEKQEQANFSRVITSLTDAVRLHLSLDATEKAAELLLEVRLEAARISDHYWRERYLREIDQISLDK